MDKIHVIAPDSFSGEAFNKVLLKSALDTEYKVYTIHPRVIDNKISKSKEIVKDLNLIFKNLDTSHKRVVIACNTLQLWLKDIDRKYKVKYKIYTTFDACEWKFKTFNEKPLWIGTTPLVSSIRNFPTLISSSNINTQELVQELIWRVKLYGDNDIRTAPRKVQGDLNLSKEHQLLKMTKMKNEIISSLEVKRVKNVILGCTELPIIFDQNNETSINFYDPAEILVEYILFMENSVKFN